MRKDVMQEAREALARAGGLASARKLTKAERAERAKRAARARWAKKGGK